MNESKIAVRYSKALFGLAQEKNVLERTFEDIVLITNTLKQSEQIDEILLSPIISTKNKFDLLLAVFEGKIDQITVSFLELVCENKREAFLSRIGQYFIDSYRKYKGITSATIVTAVELEAGIRNQIIDILKKQLDGEIELEEKINKDVIGGFILAFDNKQIDASTLNDLRKVKRELTKTEIK